MTAIHPQPSPATGTNPRVRLGARSTGIEAIDRLVGEDLEIVDVGVDSDLDRWAIVRVVATGEICLVYADWITPPL